jgi:hypothetical protein
LRNLAASQLLPPLNFTSAISHLHKRELDCLSQFALFAAFRATINLTMSGAGHEDQRLQFVFHDSSANRRRNCALYFQDLFRDQKIIMQHKAEIFAVFIRILEITTDERDGDEKRNNFCAALLLTLSRQNLCPIPLQIIAGQSRVTSFQFHFLTGSPIVRDVRCLF